MRISYRVSKRKWNMAWFLDIQDHDSKTIESKNFKFGVLSNNSLRKIISNDCIFWSHWWPPNSLISFGKFVKKCKYYMTFCSNTKRLQMLIITEWVTLTLKMKMPNHTKVSTAIVELWWRPQPQLAEFGPFAILTFPHNLRFYTL